MNELAQSSTQVANQATMAMMSRFAESSITRGDHSIVGNTRVVLEARELKTMSNTEMTEENLGKLCLSWAKRHEPIDDEAEEPTHRYQCPKCHAVI